MSKKNSELKSKNSVKKKSLNGKKKFQETYGGII